MAQWIESTETNVSEVCRKIAESIYETAKFFCEMFEPILEFCRTVAETQKEIDKNERLRKSWTTPRKIVMKSQVNMCKPARVFARANL